MPTIDVFRLNHSMTFLPDRSGGLGIILPLRVSGSSRANLISPDGLGRPFRPPPRLFRTAASTGCQRGERSTFSPKRGAVPSADATYVRPLRVLAVKKRGAAQAAPAEFRFWPEPAVHCDAAIRPKSGVNRKFPTLRPLVERPGLRSDRLRDAASGPA